MASPDGDATPNTGGNPSPTVSPFRVTYPIGGGTPTKPPEEEDEEKALADAIDAAADDSLRGEGFIGSPAPGGRRVTGAVPLAVRGARRWRGAPPPAVK